MKKNNNKGFTVVELIISFVIVMSIAIGLFKIVDSYRERQQKESYRKELNAYRDKLLRVIEDDIQINKLKSIDSIDTSDENSICSGYDQGIKITFNDNSTKELCYGNKISGKAGVIYGDIFYEVPSKFVKFEQGFLFNEDKSLATNELVGKVDSNILVVYKATKNIYSINITMKHEELKEKVNLKIVDSINSDTMGDIDSTCSGLEYNSNAELYKINMDADYYNTCGSIAFRTFKNAGLTTSVLVKNDSSTGEKLKYIDSVDKIDYLGIGSYIKIDSGAFKDVTINALNINNATTLLTETEATLNSIPNNAKINKLIIGDNIWRQNTAGMEKTIIIINAFGDVNLLGFEKGTIGATNKNTTYINKRNNIVQNPKLKGIDFKGLNSIGNYAFYRVEFKENSLIELDDVSINLYSFNNQNVNANKIDLVIGKDVIINSSNNYNFQNYEIRNLTISDATTAPTNKMSYTSAKKVIVESGQTKDSQFSGKSIEEVTLKNNVTSIGISSFYNNRIETLNIPDSVTTIGKNAFSFNQISGTLTIPISVTSIGGSAFTKNKITSVKFLSNNLERIPDNAFEENSINSLTLSNSIIYIGTKAFNKNSIKELTIPKTVYSVSNEAFNNNPLEKLHIVKCTTTLCLDFSSTTSNQLKFGNQLKTLIIDEGQIGDNSFGNQNFDLVEFGNVSGTFVLSFKDSSTKKLHISDSSNLAIGDYSDGNIFWANSFLKLKPEEIEIDSGKIGISAFGSKSGLKKVTLNEGVTVIEMYAFRNSSVQEVIIPKTISSIGKQAFYGCSNLTTINIKMTKQEWNSKVASGAITLGDAWKPSSTTLKYKP